MSSMLNNYICDTFISFPIGFHKMHSNCIEIKRCHQWMTNRIDRISMINWIEYTITYTRLSNILSLESWHKTLHFHCSLNLNKWNVIFLLFSLFFNSRKLYRYLCFIRCRSNANEILWRWFDFARFLFLAVLLMIKTKTNFCIEMIEIERWTQLSINSTTE